MTGYGIGAVSSGLWAGVDCYKALTYDGHLPDYIGGAIVAPLAAIVSGLIWPIWVPPYAISRYNIRQRNKHNVGYVTRDKTKAN